VSHDRRFSLDRELFRRRLPSSGPRFTGGLDELQVIMTGLLAHIFVGDTYWTTVLDPYPERSEVRYRPVRIAMDEEQRARLGELMPALVDRLRGV
jgi:hypothetical protein